MDIVAPPGTDTAMTASNPPPSTPPPAPAVKSSVPAQPKANGARASDDELMGDDSFGDLSRLSTKPEQPAKPTTPAPKKPEEQKPESKVEPEAQEEQKGPDGKPVNKSSVGELRKQYETTKKELYQAREENKRLKETKPQEPPELKQYKERYEALEKRLEEREEAIRYSAYERSTEYQDKYQKPFENAYKWGQEAVARLKITLEDGSTRQAMPADFDKILMMSDDGEAIDAAEALFGNKARIVLDHKWELKKLDAARFNAIEDFKKQGGEREFKTKAEETKRNEQMGQMWKELNGQAAERFPKFFKPEEGDEDGNKLLEEGYRLADSAFSSSNGRSPEDQVRLHASIRNRAAAFTREVYRTTKLEKRVSELEAELKQYQSSEPGNGEGKSGDVAIMGFEELMADT